MSVLNAQQVDQIREFNRFYTSLIGLLDEGLFKSKFSLTEARIIYELGAQDGLVAKQLGQILMMDAGYLSRVLNRLVKQGIILRAVSAQDKRQQLLSLSDFGQDIRLDLAQRSIGQVAQLYQHVDADKAKQLVAAMAKIQSLMNPQKHNAPSYILRDPEVGDLAYIAHRQSILYEQEYGFGNQYEAVVSGVLAKYIQNHNPTKEKCWIAECEGKIVGSIFCVDGGNGVAKLRLLYVDPSARGMGLGTKLISEVIKFARKNNYKKIEFWTVDCLDAALYLYAKAGFKHVSSQPQSDFGSHLNGGKGIGRQDWQMRL